MYYKSRDVNQLQKPTKKENMAFSLQIKGLQIFHDGKDTLMKEGGKISFYEKNKIFHYGHLQHMSIEFSGIGVPVHDNSMGGSNCQTGWHTIRGK